MIEYPKNDKRYKHGMRFSKENQIWRSMIKRCRNPNEIGYKNYGGRGIEVCKEWRSSFVAFYKDMGPLPSSEYSIERIDNNKGYFRNNCKWILRTEQSINRRPWGKSRYRGVDFSLKSNKWRARITKNKKTKQIGYFISEIDAANAYDKLCYKYFKNKNLLNFPKGGKYG